MKYLIKDKLRQPSSKSILHKEYHLINKLLTTDILLQRENWRLQQGKQYDETITHDHIDQKKTVSRSWKYKILHNHYKRDEKNI